MNKWINALARTRAALAGGLMGLFRKRGTGGAGENEQLEQALLSADMPLWLARELIDEATRSTGEASLAQNARRILLASLSGQAPFSWEFKAKPMVTLIVGVNGSGKTTTAAKLAWQARQRGLKPLLAAADTFRAAAVDQLRHWASKVECDIVAGTSGADASAVAYDAVQAGIARKADMVLIDTAGRMHTKKPLMDELQKMRRSISKSMDGAPHATLLVLDATLGNNAIAQARLFHDMVGLTGVVVTKLDGSAKAGFIPAINRELGVPVLFAGLGEDAADLVPFDAVEFVQSLTGAEGTAQ